ncbi:RHS repeat-associated core domain-containing protein [Pseudomonas akapageensis]|uniref:RHS repeat-associated core domain-containing protein n=1 Tax=Pseudomonas akapageensis TaxID=2609961 RepID=UPI00140785CE|nr:RHS repeat-associated core domain-containing protein [Pseudomonas akapageensis]
MDSSSRTLLCRYAYDPLDRLSGREVNGAGTKRQFYQAGQLISEVSAQESSTVMRAAQQLLALQQLQGSDREVELPQTDLQGSVLSLNSAGTRRSFPYTPYGFLANEGPLSLLGFNGEKRDPVLGHYLLGNGYRVFNTVLMRFNSPDSWSPFGKGGINCYGYCGGNPVGNMDPTGHFSWSKPLQSLFKSGKLNREKIKARFNQKTQDNLLFWDKSGIEQEPPTLNPRAGVRATENGFAVFRKDDKLYSSDFTFNGIKLNFTKISPNQAINDLQRETINTNFRNTNYIFDITPIETGFDVQMRWIPPRDTSKPTAPPLHETMTNVRAPK